MSPTGQRVAQVAGMLGAAKSPDELPWDPDTTKLPLRKDLPKIPDAPDGAAWVWGKNDYIGRLNLLTPTRVKAAADEIKTGEIVPLNLPLNVPEQPGFGREKFVHSIKTLVPGIAYDDNYQLNTQSGTQWDGFRHASSTVCSHPNPNILQRDQTRRHRRPQCQPQLQHPPLGRTRHRRPRRPPRLPLLRQSQQHHLRPIHPARHHLR
ncbi:hypothetical protein EMPG_10692 [Blastomyces silverae]|uniref:Uncharacterized protein n=1 Tax=Blastomyces silverae TaxID=2060906 RepID=A0A0H1B3D7_9EURO|nr:hypothetical protein EMPG_10692 [Blastomyces silverae]